MLNFLRTIFRGNENENTSSKYTIDAIQEFVEENITNLIQSSIDDLGKSYEEILNAKKRKELFKKQLSLCGLGDIASKQFIKSWISDLITQKYEVNEENIDYIINFDFPTVYDKFCIILNKYKKMYGYDALKMMIKENNLDELKDFNNEKMFVITEEDINHIYEDTSYSFMSFEDKLEIIVQRVYERTHGLSVVDEIRDQRCDGLSLGVSGIPIDFIYKISDMNIKNKEDIKYPLSYESVWLYFSGKEIYLSILSFGSQRELERVCKKLYKFNNQKQFTKADGFIFNNMADFSRISVFRPPYAEGWAAFIRKFDIDGNLDTLIEGENADIVGNIIKFIVRGKQNICFSGQQGVGKTTMLVGGLKKMYPNVTLRVWESYFETFLRFKMPYKNIFTLREIAELDGEKALDSLKKTNGQVTVISEAAEDRIKAYVVKGALAAAEAVMWTDHSETPRDLVQSHRNACINVGVFRDENKAEEQVISILDFDIHLKKDAIGQRYIERITEFIRLDEESYLSSADEEAFRLNAKKYFEDRTNAEKYKAVNIVEYDIDNKAYIIKNTISEKREKDIYYSVMDYDKEEFADLMLYLEKCVCGGL